MRIFKEKRQLKILTLKLTELTTEEEKD